MLSLKNNRRLSLDKFLAMRLNITNPVPSLWIYIDKSVSFNYQLDSHQVLRKTVKVHLRPPTAQTQSLIGSIWWEHFVKDIRGSTKMAEGFVTTCGWVYWRSNEASQPSSETMVFYCQCSEMDEIEKWLNPKFQLILYRILFILIGWDLSSTICFILNHGLTCLSFAELTHIFLSINTDLLHRRVSRTIKHFRCARRVMENDDDAKCPSSLVIGWLYVCRMHVVRGSRSVALWPPTSRLLTSLVTVRCRKKTSRESEKRKHRLCHVSATCGSGVLTEVENAPLGLACSVWYNRSSIQYLTPDNSNVCTYFELKLHPGISHNLVYRVASPILPSDGLLQCWDGWANCAPDWASI